jgi:acetoin utilization deacetylase AcuC-like enzyme
LNHLVEAIDYFEQYVKPNFVIYQSGVDILDSDKLGKLSINLEGCKKRDKLVIDYCFRNNIPLMSCLGGGYSTDIKTITEAHCNLFRLAKEYYD